MNFYHVSTLFTRPMYSYKDFLWPISVDAILKESEFDSKSGMVINKLNEYENKSI